MLKLLTKISASSTWNKIWLRHDRMGSCPSPRSPSPPPEVACRRVRRILLNRRDPPLGVRILRQEPHHGDLQCESSHSSFFIQFCSARNLTPEELARKDSSGRWG